MTLKIYKDLIQGSHEWLEARRGIVTASVIGSMITPSTKKPANNDKSRGVSAELVAERITGRVEETFMSFDMARGIEEEEYARDAYAEHYAPVEEIGFMTREIDGHILGFSPDGLVSDDGLIEVKSRRQKIQLATILKDEVPASNMAQLQVGLLVSGRSWIDYISFSNGMPLYRKRVYPDQEWFDAIKAALALFEKNAATMIKEYEDKIKHMPATEYVERLEDVGITF